MAEGLHDLLTLYHLVDKGSLLAAHGALALEILVAALCEKAGHHKAQRGDAPGNKHLTSGGICYSVIFLFQQQIIALYNEPKVRCL